MGFFKQKLLKRNQKFDFPILVQYLENVSDLFHINLFHVDNAHSKNVSSKNFKL